MAARRFAPRQIGDGIATYSLTRWSDFEAFLDAKVFLHDGKADHRHIWRGHRRSDWVLESSLDRLFKPLTADEQATRSLEERSLDHLEEFKYAARGRRGLHAPSMNENEWWALGQHFDLATPLLDWSHSPFVAAYFAYYEAAAATRARVIYGLDIDAVKVMNAEIVDGDPGEARPLVLEPIEPLSDENPRLVSQGALFTRGPLSLSVEDWVSIFFNGSSNEILTRIELPDRDRLVALRSLHRMNINHLSLFPDLTGASRAANLKLELGMK